MYSGESKLQLIRLQNDLLIQNKNMYELIKTQKGKKK